jgi:hypothetical protein
MAAGSSSTHASRKPEGPRKFSARTVIKMIPDPFVSFHSSELSGITAFTKNGKFKPVDEGRGN